MYSHNGGYSVAKGSPDPRYQHQFADVEQFDNARDPFPVMDDDAVAPFGSRQVDELGDGCATESGLETHPEHLDFGFDRVSQFDNSVIRLVIRVCDDHAFPVKRGAESRERGCPRPQQRVMQKADAHTCSASGFIF